MKTNRLTARKTFLILAGAFLLCLSINSFSLAFDYQASEIGPLAGYTSSRALGINNAGQVVGRFYNIDSGTGEAINRKAFIWDRAGGARLLSTLSGDSSAWGINNNGYVSGYSYTSQGNQHAVVWNSTTNAITDIGTLRNTITSVYGPTSTAYNLNDLNQVVGNADIPNDAGDFTPFHAFKYSVTTGIVDLGTFSTSSPEWQNGYSIAYDINGNGDAVGIAHDSSWAFLPFIHNSSTGMQQLQRDSNYLSGEWYAVAINGSGMIGGHVIVATNQSLPYYWPNKTSAPVKITMPAGFPYGEIYGINASGQMVGIMWSSDQAGATEHAFIFDTTNGVRDLNALINPSSGWVLNFARDINDNGQVVGYGEKSGLKRGFVLDPAGLANLKDELVCNFGATYGLWHYDQAIGWTQLNTVAPVQIISVDIDSDGQDELAASFAGYGLYIYDSTNGWTRINAVVPDEMIRFGNSLAVDYGTAYGLWQYNPSSGWAQLNTVDPGLMVAVDLNNDGADELVASFTGHGLYTYNSGTWTQINTVVPQAMIPFGNALAVDYGTTYGLWQYAPSSGWTRLNAVDPSLMVAVDLNNDGADELVASFTGYGLYTYNSGTWTQINTVVPQAVVGFGNALAVDYGTTYGIWQYNPSSGWIRLNTVDPGLVVPADLDRDGQLELSVTFTGYGLYNYDSGPWTQINSILPQGMIGINLLP
jgi:probable HAF family extracellular repeat protein